MTWPLWIVFGYLVISTLTTVGSIGKPRRPLESGPAVVAVIIMSALAGLVVLGAVIR